VAAAISLRELTLPQLIQLIERYEMPKTIEKPTKKVTVNKTAAVGKTELPDKAKKANVLRQDFKAKKDTGSKTTTKKPVAKVTKPEAKKTKASRTPKGYTPQEKSMRYFVMGALKQGLASVTRIKQRAAKLAAKAGVKQYATEESFKAFDVAFFVKMLEEKGIEIEREGEKLAISG
jgi:hypothetical protein